MREGLSASIQEAFILASAFAIVGALALVGLKEIPLRKGRQVTKEAAAESGPG